MELRFLIAFCGLAAALFAGCISTSNSSTGPVRVRVLGSTGESWREQPAWKFGVTNSGSLPIDWRANIEVRGVEDKQYSYAGGFIDWPEGSLAPGQGAEAYMIVPRKKGSVWRAVVGYCVPPSGTVSNVVTRWQKTPNPQGGANGVSCGCRALRLGVLASLRFHGARIERQDAETQRRKGRERLGLERSGWAGRRCAFRRESWPEILE